MIHLSQPESLEAVNGVVEGKTRAAKTAAIPNADESCLILIHGDAAMAGQGVVAEVFNFSKLPDIVPGEPSMWW